LFQLFATMMRCRAGGGPPRGGAYQTALTILSPAGVLSNHNVIINLA